MPQLRDLAHTVARLPAGELLRWAPEYLGELARHHADDFDRRHGTDTNTAVPVQALAADAPVPDEAELYWPIRERAFARILSELDQPPSAWAFVDLGSGKGRALLLAVAHRFASVEGVEFSPALCRSCHDNLERFARLHPRARDVQVHNVDARAFDMPEQPLVVFLNDPFGPAVLQPVIDRLVDSLRRNPRPCRVAYSLPHHRHLFERAGFQPMAEQRRSWRLDYPWVLLRGPTG